MSKICWHLIAPTSTSDFLGLVTHFLLRSNDCFFRTCMLLTGVKVHQDW